MEGRNIDEHRSSEPTKVREQSGAPGSEPSYGSNDENEAAAKTRLTDSGLWLVLASVSGAIFGFIFSGAVTLGVVTFASLLLGLLLGWVLGGRQD